MEIRMTIIVGLGNYGDRYAYTYHNIGFLTVEAIASELGLRFNKRYCDCLIAEGFKGGETVILAKPLTYMNLSGKAVYQLMKKHNAKAEDFLIIYDDIDLEKGTIRLRSEGSGGTHNGMKDIIETLGQKDIPRLRLGIGPKPEFVPLADYVLSEIPKKERRSFAPTIDEAVKMAVEITAKKRFDSYVKVEKK